MKRSAAFVRTLEAARAMASIPATAKARDGRLDARILHPAILHHGQRPEKPFRRRPPVLW